MVYVVGVKTGRWDDLSKENMQELERWRDVEQLEAGAQGPILQPDLYMY